MKLFHPFKININNIKIFAYSATTAISIVAEISL